MSAFTLATTPRPVSPGRFTAQVPDGWQQGRGAFGGLVLGLLERAAEQTLADAQWPLRAFNGEIFAPVVTGPSEVTVEVLRRGSGMATLESRLLQGGELRARSTSIFGRSRVADRNLVTLAAPKLPPPEQVEVAPLGPPVAAVFALHLEYRPTAPLPFSGASQPGAAGWLRFRDPPARLGMAELIGLADAYYPATFAIEEGPRPMGTVSFTFEPQVDLATVSPDGPFAYRCTVPAAFEGYSVELREVWDANGRLLALNQQSFVVIK